MTWSKPCSRKSGSAASAIASPDVEPARLRVRDADGVASGRLFACGIPLEGVEWNNAIGARARSDAALFRQADVIAGQALTAARTALPGRTGPTAPALQSSGPDR
ncbi:hypothetical protein [Streptomyces sp. NPDC001508]|uniref:hypothetical protein n=1 Tax=Streptomyces sp. NPDC001508 TaxID=3154656 RepID=UPI003319A206